MQNSEKYKNEIAKLLNEKTNPKSAQKSNIKQSPVFGNMHFHNCTVTLIHAGEAKKTSED